MGKFTKYGLLILWVVLTGFQGYSNIGQTTLNGAITNATNPITVGSTASFPALSNPVTTFTIKIDNEYMVVSTASGTTFTVVSRGQEGSAAASHGTGATVTEVLSAAMMNNLYQQGSGSPLAGNPLIFGGTGSINAISPVGSVVYTSAYAGASPDAIHAAQAACSPITWVSAHSYSQFDVIEDSNGEMEYRNVAGTSGGSTPSWPAAPCAAGTATNDGSTTNAWLCLAYGAPSSTPCTIAVTPGTYSLTNPLIIGPNGKNSNTQVLLMYPGSNINTSYGGYGASHHGAGVVIGNHGGILGLGNMNGGSINSVAGANYDAIVETWSAYMAFLAIPELTVTPNNFMRGVVLNDNGGTINKALFWPAAVDGQADYSDNYISAGHNGDVGILVSGIGSGGSNQYNAVTFSNNWVTGNNANVGGIGLDIDCSTYGGNQSPQLTWIGGVVDDFGAGPPDSTDVVVNGNCRSTEIIGLYTEPGAESTGLTGLSLTNVINFEALQFTCNSGGSYTNCVNIHSVNTGAGSAIIHVNGVCNGCGSGDRVLNTIGGATSISGSGSFDYSYSSDGTTSYVHP